MQTKIKAQSAITLASIIWGITPIFVEIALDYLTPLNIMTFRFGIAIIVLSIFLPIIKERKGLSLLKSKTCILLGWLISFGYLTSTIGQEMTTPGLATLISTSYVIIVPFISWKLEDSKLSKRTLLLAIIALVGIFLTTFNGNWKNLSSVTSVGTIYLLVAALSWGLNIVLSGKALNKNEICKPRVDMLSFLYATILHTFLPLLLLSFLTTSHHKLLSTQLFLILVFLGIFSTLVTFSLYNWALSRMGSVRTTFYLLLQIIVPFLYELIILESSYSIWVLSGIFLLFTTMILIDVQKTSDMTVSKDQKYNQSVLAST
jgi:drug/metabolite transporter (DMT)-like permease